jgi:cytochrome c-type biogenesis protein CcmF
MEYIGEHLLPGKIGNLFISLSFAAALCASVGYFLSIRAKDSLWTRIGTNSFYLHGFAVLGIIVTLFLMILNHYFEYQYVWQHSSKSLPVRYMLSCFWEGQEGSFLLWTFWHVVLSMIIIRWSGVWENSVMFVISLVQVFLASMLLGVYFGDYRLGSNPFLLLREHPEFSNLPFVQVADYLKNLDGRGLNPLLQNYWMTIHPPILFLGFASTLVPFAFASAGLIERKYTEWVKPALPWTFFGIMIFGTGILMGGAWAYEALSFGGFWAWDPVENASLVPWIVLVSAGHLMLIFNNRKRSLKSAMVLSFLSFILVLYSTFLTRSGILGDTSVHAFTDLGMSGQLLVYLGFFVIVPFGIFFFRMKEMPSETEEDSLTSREFWMFIASLVLIISAFQITFTTSIPVINKIFGSSLAPPTEAVEHYNSWQTPLAVIVAILIAVTQFFKYKSTDPAEFSKKIRRSLFAAVLGTIAIAVVMEIKEVFHILLLLTSLFAVAANFDYILKILDGKYRKAGASVAHIGFALILCGAMISMSRSNVISRNTSTVDLSQLGKDFSNNENIMLSRGDTLSMGDYFVTYHDHVQKGFDHYFMIDYLSKDEKGFKKEFTLEPLVQNNPRMGLIAEPSTHHQIHRDIYTHVTYAPVKKEEDESETSVKSVSMATGDTLFTNSARLVLIGLDKEIDRERFHLKDSDLAVAAVILVTDMKGHSDTAYPIYAIRGNYLIPEPAEVKETGIKINFTGIDTESGKIGLELTESPKKKDFIVMRAIIFPGINVLWMGAIIMMIGSALAVIERLRKAKQSAR